MSLEALKQQFDMLKMIIPMMNPEDKILFLAFMKTFVIEIEKEILKK